MLDAQNAPHAGNAEIWYVLGTGVLRYGSVASVMSRIAPNGGGVVGRPSFNLQSLTHVLARRDPDRRRFLNEGDLARLFIFPHLYDPLHR